MNSGWNFARRLQDRTGDSQRLILSNPSLRPLRSQVVCLPAILDIPSFWRVAHEVSTSPALKQRRTTPTIPAQQLGGYSSSAQQNKTDWELRRFGFRYLHRCPRHLWKNRQDESPILQKENQRMTETEQKVRYAIGSAAAAAAIFAPISYKWKGILTAIAAETILAAVYETSPISRLLNS